MPSTAVIDVTDASFQQDVIERSNEVPVVVDFWAAWCGPCRTLSPVLERLAEESGGAWILAKVDVDANQGVAGSFGVQGIPAVHAFKNGRPVAQFVGALPEPQVREWLKQLGPTPADDAMQAARDAEMAGNTNAALEAYRTVLAHEPANADARAGVARLELATRTQAIDEAALAARAQADPSDVEAAVGLADLAFARGDVTGACDRLIAAVAAATGDEQDRLRAHLVELLDTLPADDERALAARRGLANALF